MIYKNWKDYFIWSCKVGAILTTVMFTLALMKGLIK